CLYVVLLFFLRIRRPARPPLFPYTTLFRSLGFSSSPPGRRAPCCPRCARPHGGPGPTSTSLPRTSRRTRPPAHGPGGRSAGYSTDRKSTRLNSSHVKISYAVFCLKKKTQHD